MPSKTRSQLALGKPDYDTFGTSSKKKGTKGSARSLVATSSTEDSSPTDATMNEEEGLFPPAKRPASSAKGEDGEELQERVIKRVKRVTDADHRGESSNLETSPHASTSQPPPSTSSGSNKPSSTGSISSPRPAATDVTLTPRARSIPMDGPIPHLDLTKVPPSPWRSPSKGKAREMRRMPSVPPPDAIRDANSEAQHDADGDVNMEDGGTSHVPDAEPRPPPSRTPTSASLAESEEYLDVEVAVKTHDGEADPASQAEQAPSHPRTPSTSRLPVASAPKPAGQQVQLTLAQAFSFATRPGAVPAKGLKARMKPKNSSGSNTPITSSHSTPTATTSHLNSSKPAVREKSKPIVATPRAKAASSSTAVASLKPSAIPVSQSFKISSSAPGDKTPGPSVPKTPKAAPSLLPRTPATARQRSKSVGPSVAKTPARTFTSAEDVQARGRSKTPGATITKSAAKSRLPRSPPRVTSPPTSNAVIPRVQSPEAMDPPRRGRSPTPRGPPSLPSTPSRLSSLSPLTDASREGTPIRTRASREALPVDDAATPKPSSVLPKENPSAPPVTDEPLPVALDVPALSSIAGPVPEPSQPAVPPVPVPKPRRKTPFARQASMPPMSRAPTRSSLRLKENKKYVEESPESQELSLPKKVNAKAGTSTGLNSGVASTSQSKTVPIRKRAQSVAAFARPTESSAAKSSPVKPRPPAATSRFSNSRSMSRPPESTIARSTGHRNGASISSLSNLSMALEKFNTPAFSRPNTSLGFSRDLDRNSDPEEMKMDVDSEPPSAMSSNPPSTSSVVTSSGSRPAPRPTPRSTPFQRASTVGPSLSTSSSTSSSASRAGIKRSEGTQKLTTLMGPPPLPKGKGLPNGPANGAVPQTDKPRINVHSGIVPGKPRGKMTFGNTTATKTMFGIAPIPGFPIRGSRVTHKASRMTSLPTVEGSPVKGGGNVDEAAEAAEEDVAMITDSPEEANPFAPGPSGAASTPTDVPPAADDTTPQQKEARAAYKDDSRRVSMVSRMLAQSAAASPMTPPRKPPASEGKGKGRAVSSTFPSTKAQDARTEPVARGTGAGAHVARPHRSSTLTSMSVDASPVEAGASSTSNTSTGTNGATTSVRVLKGCVVFVDVKNENGLDVGSLFVEMLQQMGAKILSRVGQSCTHIVYKDGLASTSNRWRALNDPKPLVVGIGWVVACAEQKAHVPEQKYLISMDMENIAGTNKRRKSFLPKNILESPERPSQSPQIPPNAGDTSGDRSLEVTFSPASEGASANNSFEHLPPLERVRRRQSALFNTLS
ncbi:BRCT domain-containing protein [Phanerochaete sordida]|uniref:BRCT domain-containing protein n=1 Tax=Phanerochaete sordida TaxID=48140 RepID=A0A9P3LEZ2_9APHY|nr:BRCT domain-containing protein [Phanerochaete sordida]